MATLDHLLASCAFHHGWSLHLKPGRPPLMRPRGTFYVFELETGPLTADEIRTMVYGVLSAEQIVEFESELDLAFNHSLEWPGLGEVVFSGSIFQTVGGMSAVFHNVEPVDQPAPGQEPSEPEADDDGGSLRDRGDMSPVFAPVGPRVPTRWSHDAKPIPKEGESDDNPAAQ